MSLPKEPRQKMINMMYLVLTALLALNVSAEIINAFKTVDNSLVKSNGTLTATSGDIYNSLKASLSDAKTHENAAIWEPKAQQVAALSKTMSDYIDNLKLTLKREAGYAPEKGDTIYKYDNLDAPTRLFDTKGEGEKLRTALDKYKADVLAIDPEIAKEFASKIPVNTAIPASQSGNTNQTWTTAYFHMTPTIAALTMLSKFQNDVKNTEYQVANYCLTKISAVKIIYDKFEPLVGTSSTYLMPGEEMEVKAGVGAFNSSVKPVISIDGRNIPVNESGVAETKFNVGGSGSRSLNVTVTYVDPTTGQNKTISKRVDYTVGQASGVAVMADKMNVLYIGVDNPLTITAGAGSEKVSASLTGGSINHAGGNHFVAKPGAGSGGEQTVTVMVEGKPAGRVTFRVKNLPPATGYVGTSGGGLIPSASFKAMGGVRAVLENSEFSADYEVLSYTIAGMGPEFPDYIAQQNNGPRWSGNAATLVSKLKPGSGAYIDNIKARGPDGRVITLKPLSFILR